MNEWKEGKKEEEEGRGRREEKGGGRKEEGADLFWELPASMHHALPLFPGLQ